MKINNRNEPSNLIMETKMKYFVLPALVMCVFLTVPLSSQADTIVTDGLISYWTFDTGSINGKTVKDDLGNNNATIIGDPKIVGGRVNRALKFDGVDDYINLTNLGNFGRKIETSTFEIWVKTDFTVDWSTLFKVLDPECGMAWGMDINRTIAPPNREPLGLVKGERICGHPNYKYDEEHIIIHVGTYIKQGNSEKRGYSVSGWKFPIFDGEWHHLVYVNGLESIDESGKKWRERALYFDGERQWLQRSPQLEVDTYQPFVEPVFLAAGNNQGVAEGFFNGIIDEVRIYNRALNDEEVMQNMTFAESYNVEPIGKISTVWGELKKR